MTREDQDVTGHPQNRSQRSVRALIACLLAASIAGCAALKKPESQPFAGSSPCQSASIVYRIERPAAGSLSRETSWLSLLDTDPGRGAEPQVTTLAIRYPHPAGRAGYARVEYIVESKSDAPAERAANPWIQRARQLADENLAGITLGAGSQAAMGLDVPVADLAPLLAQLEHPPAAPALGRAATDSAAPSTIVRASGTVNGAALPTVESRVIELDRLAARVRRIGNPIPRRSILVEPAIETSGTMVAQTPPARRWALLWSRSKQCDRPANLTQRPPGPWSRPAITRRPRTACRRSTRSHARLVRRGEGYSPVFLRGLRKTGTVPSSFKTASKLSPKAACPRVAPWATIMDRVGRLTTGTHHGGLCG